MPPALVCARRNWGFKRISVPKEVQWNPISRQNICPFPSARADLTRLYCSSPNTWPGALWTQIHHYTSSVSSRFSLPREPRYLRNLGSCKFNKVTSPQKSVRPSAVVTFARREKKEADLLKTSSMWMWSGHRKRRRGSPSCLCRGTAWFHFCTVCLLHSIIPLPRSTRPCFFSFLGGAYNHSTFIWVTMEANRWDVTTELSRRTYRGLSHGAPLRQRATEHSKYSSRNILVK